MTFCEFRFALKHHREKTLSVRVICLNRFLYVIKMPKRNSVGNTSGSNTLFNYFIKSPAASPKTPQQNRGTASASNSDTTPKSSFKKEDPNGSKNNKNAENKCSDDESPLSLKPKRLRLIDSDSDRENENDNSQSIDHVPKKKKAKKSRPASEPSKPAQPKKKIKIDSEGKTYTSFEEKLKEMAVQDVQDVDDTLEEMDDEPVLWLHKKLEFLKPNKIKDINGNKADDPNYDAKTLFVPKDYLDGLTPVKCLILTFIFTFDELIF